ncbi:HDOD domain-containing protein [Deferrisoma palaeochoriense]
MIGATHPARPLPKALPTLPAVAARIVALFASPEFEIADVVGTLEHDPPVSARVLRLANSAYYGFPGRVDRLDRAVVLLGATTVQALALATAVMDLWKDPPPASVRALWVHSYLAAEGCRFLGRRHPVTGFEPDALFVAGLVHDLGKFWFLSEAAEAYASELAERSGPELRAAEEERFGEDHAAAGRALLEAWNFPPGTAALAGFHHGPALRAELRPAQSVVAAANRAAGGSPEPSDLPPALEEDLARHLDARRGAAEAFVEALV